MTEAHVDEFVRSRQIGSATVTAISDGSGLSTIIRMLVDVPESVWRQEVQADANGDVRLGYNVAHIRLGSASILVDLGFDDPSPTSPWQAPRHVRSPGVPAGLAALGIAPGDITHVLITHAHGDHIAGATIDHAGQRVPRYSRARHYIGRADWEGNPGREKSDSTVAIQLGTLANHDCLELVDGDHEIVPGVSLIHAPGETPGHSIVRLESDGAVFYFLGDLFHHPCEVNHVDWVPQGRDPARMRASRERLIARAIPEQALLMTTHMPFPAFGRIVSTGGSAAWTDVR